MYALYSLHHLFIAILPTAIRSQVSFCKIEEYKK